MQVLKSTIFAPRDDLQRRLVHRSGIDRHEIRGRGRTGRPRESALLRSQPAARRLLHGILALVLTLASARAAAARPAVETAPTLGGAADAAALTLTERIYAGAGRWNVCVPDACGTAARDWGADALTFALFLRWRTAHDARTVPLARALGRSLPSYGSCRRPHCGEWSDVPMWDAVAAARIYAMTGDRDALTKARRAFALVDSSDAYARGACPAVSFQRADGRPNALKTLETDSNYVKAALLLERLTGEARYLRAAQHRYASIRRYFTDPGLPLYTAYVFDDGRRCRQLPRRFFASVNGNMIENGLLLAARTGNVHYRREALATARAVADDLADADGVYANVQAGNDVAEPLIEAMYDAATQAGETFARRWLLCAATVAQPAASGAYGRFFDGPPPAGSVSAWSFNGGLALMFAAAALDPHARAATGRWARAQYVADPISAAPASIAFTGRAVALIGTIGDVCCEAGHVRVFIDGRETVDGTGIWQNKSPAGRRLPKSVLLAWRWPVAGYHHIVLAPGIANGKEGRSYIRLDGYDVVH